MTEPGQYYIVARRMRFTAPDSGHELVFDGATGEPYEDGELPHEHGWTTVALTARIVRDPFAAPGMDDCVAGYGITMHNLPYLTGRWLARFRGTPFAVDVWAPADKSVRHIGQYCRITFHRVQFDEGDVNVDALLVSVAGHLVTFDGQYYMMTIADEPMPAVTAA